MIDCHEIVELLSDYVDGEMDEETRARLDEHLEDCPPCLRFLDTFREMIRATHRVRCEEMPAELRDRLHQFLKQNVYHRS